MILVRTVLFFFSLNRILSGYFSDTCYMLLFNLIFTSRYSTDVILGEGKYRLSLKPNSMACVCMYVCMYVCTYYVCMYILYMYVYILVMEF